MRQWLIEQLQLPKASVVNRKIPKRTLFTQGDLTPAEKELFTSDVESLYLLSVMNKQSMNIPAYINDDFHYAELNWIHIKLRNTKHLIKIIATVHKTIPNPLVILIESEEGQLKISTCHKRVNRNDSTKIVLDKLEITEWFSPKESNLSYQQLLDRLRVSNLSFSDLYRFYHDIYQYICCEKAIDLIGVYPSKKTNTEDVLRMLNHISVLNDELKQLQNEQKNNLDFGAKMELHMKLKRKEQQADTVKQQLKELC